MIGGSLGIALYVGSNVAYTADSQASLTTAWTRTHPHLVVGGSSPNFVSGVPHPRLALGQPLARIYVPKINWDGVVLEGTDLRVLAGGPGHMQGTAYPGENDQMVISNHNSFSLSWGQVQVGDQIVLQTNYGTFTYRVTGFRVIEANDGSIAASTHRATMSFTTCYPLYAGAFARQRYVVDAELVQ